MTYISNTFPTAIQTGTDPIGTDEMFTFDHAGLENFQNDSILALKNKVGVDGSAVNTSHDYKLSGVATGDKAVSKTGTETLTNKTLTSPIITGGSVENTNISGTFTIAGTITDSGNYTHSGTNTFTGSTTFNTSLPTSSVTPFNSSDLTTKTYVDSQINNFTNTFFGNGADGDVVISTNTTLSRDMYYNNLTVNNTITLNSGGYRIFVKGTLTKLGNAKIIRNGGNGTNASGTTPGTGGTLSAGTLSSGTTGGNGAASPTADSQNGINATGASNLISSIGTTGVNGSSAIAGKGGTNNVSTGVGGNNNIANTITFTTFPLYPTNLVNQIDYTIGSGINYLRSSAQANGGASGGNGYSSAGGVYGTGGAGGGGGASGGILLIVANTIIETTTSRFESIGGNGGNGGNGLDGNVTGGTSRGGGGGGNGGNGGNGGCIILIYKSRTGSVTNTDVSGGSPGTGGTKGSDWNGSGAITSPSTNGVSGVSGASGNIITVQI